MCRQRIYFNIKSTEKFFKGDKSIFYFKHNVGKSLSADIAISTMGSKLTYYKNDGFERVLLNGNVCEIL